MTIRNISFSLALCLGFATTAWSQTNATEQSTQSQRTTKTEYLRAEGKAPVQTARLNSKKADTQSVSSLNAKQQERIAERLPKQMQDQLQAQRARGVQATRIEAKK